MNIRRTLKAALSGLSASFHNVTTGATSNPGASVTVNGGTTFYLSAPLSQTGDSGGRRSVLSRLQEKKEEAAKINQKRQTPEKTKGLDR